MEMRIIYQNYLSIKIKGTVCNLPTESADICYVLLRPADDICALENS